MLDHGARWPRSSLALVCSLGIIMMLEERQWHGPGHPKNRGAKYGLPKDDVVAFNVQWLTVLGRGEGKEESIYITDRSVFLELILMSAYP